MQPGGATRLEMSSKPATTRGFGGDSFRNYMTNKIENQRKQFGGQLPPLSPLPPPPPPTTTTTATTPTTTMLCSKRVQFNTLDQKGQYSTVEKKELGDMGQLIAKLRKRHGRGKRVTKCFYGMEQSSEISNSPTYRTGSICSSTSSTHVTMEPSYRSDLEPPTLNSKPTTSKRPDLFFQGVCVLVNGYTNPDNETIQRMLHKHGGDLEKYETMRITHIIAIQLSMAKANIYKKQRKPIPVCHPKWIVDCVHANKLLPYADYLLSQVKDKTVVGIKLFWDRHSHHGKHVNVNVEPTSIVVKGQTYNTDTTRKRRRDQCNIQSTENRLRDDKDDHSLMDQYDRCTNTSHQLTDYPETESTNNNSHHVQLEIENLLVDHINDDCELDKNHESYEYPIANTDGDLPIESLNQNHHIVSTEYHHPMEVDVDICSMHHEIHADHGSTLDRTDSKYIHGKLRTTGTDPDFLESFFLHSRLSFIGNFKQRTRASPIKKTCTRIGINSTKFIFHIDMDSFFASVVLRNYPEYREKPVAISHNGTKEGMDCSIAMPSRKSTSECATCNYVARTFGIEKGMFLGRARELCPELIVLPYDFEGYEEVSEQVTDILYRQAELFDGTVEQISCDEAYMELCLSSDDDDDISKSLEDVAKGIADNIRECIFSTTQCTATVGVASNKLLSKLATDKAKPNGSHVVKDYHELLEPLKLRDLHGIGSRLDRKLAAEGIVSVRDIWDLGDHAEGELCRILGIGTGTKIIAYCRGEDDRPVKPVRRKTIGVECNYGVRFDGPYGVNDMVQGLAKETQNRMEGVEVRGTRVTLKVKQRKANATAPQKFLGHGSCHSLSRSMDIPGGKPTRDWKEFSRLGITLFDELGISSDDVRGMGITISKLTHDIEPEIETMKANRISTFFKEGCDPKFDIADSTVLSHGDEISCLLDNIPGILTLPSSSQIDNEVLASLPDEIRAEIEAARAQRLETNRSKKSFNSNEFPPLEESQIKLSEHDNVYNYHVPPTSQLHMSQVQVLPSSIRRQIMAKLKQREGKLEFNHAANHGITSLATGEHEYQQLSVKRMFHLAAVKSGNKSISHPLSNSMTMTQLDRLPLAIQLQIANNDQKELGSLLNRKSALFETDQQKKRRGRDAKANSLIVTNTSAKRPQRAIQTNVTQEVEPATFQYDSMNPREFYLENILPLRRWMDFNSDASEGALDHVLSFLSICVEEDRLDDVVKLLRSIKNRRDTWNAAPFSVIVSRVDDMTYKSKGKRLDIEWLGLSH